MQMASEAGTELGEIEKVRLNMLGLIEDKAMEMAAKWEKDIKGLLNQFFDKWQASGN